MIVGPGGKGEGASFLLRGLLFAVAAAGCCLWLWLYSSRVVAREADRLMQLEVSRGSFSGAVLVSDHGKVVFAKAYGLANASWRIPNTLHTRFHIASITKSFTATVVMMLQKDGRLSVSDGICKYLSPCPAGWEPIELHHLLSHTSGIFNLTEVRDLDRQIVVPQTRAEILARFENVPLAFAPGTQYHYSNSNYYLLGMVIERVTGKSFGAVLRERILEPLGMNETGLNAQGTVVAEEAEGYATAQPNTLVRALRMDPSWSFSSGAMYSTVGDLLKWSEAIASGRLLPRETLERMWTPVAGEYGYGWETPTVGEGTFGRRIVEHSGRVPGFVANISLGVDDGVTVIVVANNISSSPPRIARGLRAIQEGIPYKSPLRTQPVTLPDAVLRRYVGSYDLAGATWDVTLRNGRLFARSGQLPEIELIPVSEADFVLADGDIEVHGVVNEDGRVKELVVRQGVKEGPMPKVK